MSLAWMPVERKRPRVLVMPMTRDIATQAAMEVGDRSMFTAGRSKWAEPDYEAAAREYARLLPLEEGK